MDFESVFFEIISNVGSAKSFYMEAIACAKKGNIAEAREKIKEGEKCFSDGHKAHMELVCQEADGKEVPFSLLLVHVEDQLMAAETTKTFALEFIDLYESR